jgi:hypothetical protein
VLITSPGSPRSLDAYADPVPVEGVEGLEFLPPLTAGSLYDYAREDVHGGVDVRLACGITVSIPVALTQHRQIRLSGPRPTIGDPVTEYGRLAVKTHRESEEIHGIQQGHPDVGRLLVLAISQHYAVTAHMIDALQVLSVDDILPIMGAVWHGDPKALAPASEGERNASLTSASTGA